MTLALDHLVLAARTLDEGVAWCETTLGLRPEAGGQHLFMGTHNRVFGIGSKTFARSYFEIIAIDPSLPAPQRARWFGLDEPALQRALVGGPRLVSWVARCDVIAATHATLRAAGIDCGVVEATERATPRGLLRWKISLRADGRRLLGGAAPALIEWSDVHPTDSMTASGIELKTMRLGRWPDALAPLLPPQIECDASPGAPPVSVVLSCPRGLVALHATPNEA
jgi:catechol 2,3-dioxygenase-like lactoylglutathione lyase family enzyme